MWPGFGLGADEEEEDPETDVGADADTDAINGVDPIDAPIDEDDEGDESCLVLKRHQRCLKQIIERRLI